ncbi:MAG: hypothetical protein R3222_05600 [Balneolaceae bacterium]|nr:hypothetical protein [Balneolaceae bacterium]
MRVIKIFLWIALIAFIAVAGFYWNEARKEVVFLCSNFKAGVTEESVLRQLDTGNFLRYHSENLPDGKRIVVESPYSLYMYTCTIDFDSSAVVKESFLE